MAAKKTAKVVKPKPLTDEERIAALETKFASLTDFLRTHGIHLPEETPEEEDSDEELE